MPIKKNGKECKDLNVKKRLSLDVGCGLISTDEKARDRNESRDQKMK